MTDFVPDRPVAYFCAEYGLQADLPLYAGGLGVLAGDTVKETADQNFPLVAVGLLYRGGKAIQNVDESGWPNEIDLDIDPVKSGFEHVYAIDDSDQPLFVRIHLTTTDVWARVWKRTVNNTTIYLLDTDTDQNEPEERGIAKALYYGSEEFLVKQQMILGIGGVKLLRFLDIHPVLYHVNEGRPAFLYWEVIRGLMDKESLSYKEAAQKAKEMIVYTNHTLVKAGNQSYDKSILENYGVYYAKKMGVGVEELLAPGFEKGAATFNMTRFALNTARKASSVSQSHFELSKNIWPDYDWVNITNGVHMPTWQDSEIGQADKAQTEILWQVHAKKKQELVDFVQQRTGFGYDPNRLVISWARRFAGYKRPTALFEDIKRLVAIVKDKDKPVQLLVTGKAHPTDTAAKKLIQEVIGYMKDQLSGNALFIPNYDLDVSRYLVRGSDVWLNTPVVGQEACGTSGMKAIANGVLQLTVEDGWTAEVDWHDIGWTLDSNHLTQTLYFRLEDDVIPMFYHRNEAGVPVEWVERMRRSIELAERFSTTRMLTEYKEKLYS